VTNAWTGGQYSLVRAIVGLYFFVHFIAGDLATPVLVVAAIAAVCFAIGWHDRVAAIVMACVLVWLFGRNPPAANPLLLVAGGLLIVHACLPRAPFLSVDARGRVDPRGGWSMPPPLFAAMWIVMSIGYGYSAWTMLISPSRTGVDLGFGLALLLAPLALVRRVRPWLWLAMLALHLGLMLLIDFADLSLMMVIVHLFTFDPAWVPRRLPETTDLVLYDGTCGLCHRGMRWLIAEDATGTSFRYAALETERPDSVIVKTQAGEVLMRSAASMHLLARLGGLWRVIGVLFGLLPRRVRDAMYDFVARIRYRIFGRTKDACPLIPPDLRTRFE